MNNAYVPTTGFTRMFGKLLFGDWYGETHINGESANSDDAVLGMGSTALVFIGIEGANATQKPILQLKNSLFNFRVGKKSVFNLIWKQPFVRFAFEKSMRSPTVEGAASGTIEAWHFNLSIFGNKYHIYLNKCKYYMCFM